MKRVIIESPFRGDTERNIAYARRAIMDSISRGEAPFASHLIYTQVLNELVPHESATGILLGFEWYKVVAACCVYTDYGISHGMMLGMEEAIRRRVPIIQRKIL